MKLEQKWPKYHAGIILTIIFFISAGSGFAQGYGGPSMLSRGGNRPGQRGSAPVGIAVYGGLRAVADSGLMPVQLQEDGTFRSDTIASAQVELGAYGTHSWRKSILGLDYRGDYRKSFNNARRHYDGLNQALSLDFEYQATKRTQVMLRQIAGTSNRAFGAFAGPAMTSLQWLGLANNEVFDTRVYYMQTSGALARQTSARTTWMVSGDGFIVKRPSNALVSLTGYRAGAGWSYRINRRDSVGVLYSYTHFNYQRNFGGADTQGLAFQAQRAFTRNLTLNGVVGVFRVDAFGTQEVRLSPEVAALLGRPTGVAAFNRRTYVPQIQAAAVYTLERSVLTASVIVGVTPGNGVYLTSRQDAVYLGYSYTGIRKLSIGASSSYSRTESVSLAVGNRLTAYRTYQVGTGMNYRISALMNLSTQFDYRKFDSPTIRGREGYALAVSFTVSPTRLPLSIW